MEYFLKGLDGTEKMGDWRPITDHKDAGKDFGTSRWRDVKKELILRGGRDWSPPVAAVTQVAEAQGAAPPVAPILTAVAVPPFTAPHFAAPPIPTTPPPGLPAPDAVYAPANTLAGPRGVAGRGTDRYAPY